MEGGAPTAFPRKPWGEIGWQSEAYQTSVTFSTSV